jgi:hypothetical protein
MHRNKAMKYVGKKRKSFSFDQTPHTRYTRNSPILSVNRACYEKYTLCVTYDFPSVGFYFYQSKYVTRIIGFENFLVCIRMQKEIVFPFLLFSPLLCVFYAILTYLFSVPWINWRNNFVETHIKTHCSCSFFLKYFAEKNVQILNRQHNTFFLYLSMPFPVC